MRIEMENGTVVCAAENWKTLSYDEHKFLSDCYGYAVWVDFTASGKLKMQMPGKAWHAQRVAQLLRIMLAFAKAHNIEVRECVNSFYNEWKAKADEEKAQEEKLAYIESLRQRWESRQRTGCADCRECERIGDAWFRCKHSGDELDTRFSEVYDPVTQCMLIFHEVGVPNEHCKDYYQERKESR